MSYNVGVWIDHKKAVIVSASTDRVTARTLESEVERTPIIPIRRVGALRIDRRDDSRRRSAL